MMPPTYDELKAFLEKVARIAPPVEEFPVGAFGAEPPHWAVWDDYGMHGERCGRCDAWCSIVRPGKTQCDACGDDDLTALAIEARRLSGRFVTAETVTV